MSTKDIDITRPDYLWHSLAELGNCALRGDRILWRSELKRLQKHLDCIGHDRIAFTDAEAAAWKQMFADALEENDPLDLPVSARLIGEFWRVYQAN